MYIRENDRIEPSYYLWKPEEFHIFIFPYRQDDMDVIGTFPDMETARKAADIVKKYRGHTSMYERRYRDIDSNEEISGFQLLEYFSKLQETEPETYKTMEPETFFNSCLWQSGGNLERIPS